MWAAHQQQQQQQGVVVLVVMECRAMLPARATGGRRAAQVQQCKSCQSKQGLAEEHSEFSQSHNHSCSHKHFISAMSEALPQRKRAGWNKGLESPVLHEMQCCGWAGALRSGPEGAPWWRPSALHNPLVCEYLKSAGEFPVGCLLGSRL